MRLHASNLLSLKWGILSFVFIQFISLSIGNVIFHVFRYAVQFVLVARNMVMETCLPCNFDISFVGGIGNRRSKFANNNGQLALHIFNICICSDRRDAAHHVSKKRHIQYFPSFYCIDDSERFRKCSKLRMSRPLGF